MNGLIAMIVRGLYSSAGYLRETQGKQQLRELHAMLLYAYSLFASTRCFRTRSNTKLKKLFVAQDVLRDAHR